MVMSLWARFLAHPVHCPVLLHVKQYMNAKGSQSTYIKEVKF